MGPAALIFGLATRYAAAASAVMVAAFWFAKGQGFLAGQNHDSVWFMIFIVLAEFPGDHAERQGNRPEQATAHETE